MVAAETLWTLVAAVVLRGMSVAAAVRELRFGLAVSSAYRLVERVRRTQARIRTLLLGVCAAAGVAANAGTRWSRR